MSMAARAFLSTLVIALLLALAPRGAHAHGGHAHEDAAPVPAGAPSQRASARPAADPAAARFAAPCPGKSGTSCCCGGGAGCIGDGRVSLAAGGALAIVSLPATARVASRLDPAEPESRLLPSASPRGPPHLS
jgi:hypothetical protein